ncbi:alpha/beta hydrolase [Jatrophihabitans sp. GAS493]|uniref:alpha/beta hydrolase n=1 Tax=Jatrophihabitans sp. GAS493 TaxID=1907575 RepID=UPI00155FA758|nr:alpha/beta fold hydrolase [Jatrophihabitans sp. GAS493]
MRLSGAFRPGPPGGLSYVLAHGFTGSSSSRQITAVAEQLGRAGNSVLAFDARGHGRSGGYSTLGEREIHDVAAAVEFLRERRPDSPVVLIGWSMGASSVLRHAGLGGDADAVVSVSSPGFWWERGTRPMRLVHWAVMTRTGRLATRLTRRTRVGSGWVYEPEQPVDVVAAIAPRPVLLVHGENDHYFPIRHAQALADAAAAADFWLEPQMGHGEHATDAQLVDRIDAWARQTLGGG